MRQSSAHFDRTNALRTKAGINERHFCAGIQRRGWAIFRAYLYSRFNLLNAATWPHSSFECTDLASTRASTPRLFRIFSVPFNAAARWSCPGFDYIPASTPTCQYMVHSVAGLLPIVGLLAFYRRVYPFPAFILFRLQRPGLAVFPDFTQVQLQRRDFSFCCAPTLTLYHLQRRSLAASYVA